MYLIFEYPYDPALGSVVIDTETGGNMVFDTQSEAEEFARDNCIHCYAIIYTD